MKEKIAVIASENGKAKILEEHEGNISEIVRHIARKALEIWDNEKSDFIIIRDRYPVEINLPITKDEYEVYSCLLYTSPSPRDLSTSRMPSSA